MVCLAQLVLLTQVPAAGKGLANRFGLGSGTPSQVASANLATNAQNSLNSMTPTQLGSMPPAQLQ